MRYDYCEIKLCVLCCKFKITTPTLWAKGREYLPCLKPPLVVCSRMNIFTQNKKLYIDSICLYAINCYELFFNFFIASLPM